MKIRTLTTVLALIFVSSVAFSQEFVFRVIANKGNNEVKTGDTWQPVKTGASLKQGDEIKLVENAYLGLVHASGKPLEVKKAGPYKVADLAAMVSGNSSVLNKYTDFILSSNAEEKKNKLSATGAVHRATDNAAIAVSLPDNQFAGIYNATAVINWDGEIAGPYVVTLKNMFEDELMKVETPENQFVVNLNEAKLANETAILVEIRSKADPKLVSKQHLIKKLAPAEQEKVKALLSEISSEVAEENAMNKLMLAGFYEANNLYIDAITAYEEAIKLAPDVEAFKEAYQDFLLRHNMTKQ